VRSLARTNTECVHGRRLGQLTAMSLGASPSGGVIQRAFDGCLRSEAPGLAGSQVNLSDRTELLWG
jgi:hypothetical protein